MQTPRLCCSAPGEGQELTEHSDNDWAILVSGPEREVVRPAVAEMEARIGVEERKPGTQGVFGEAVFCDHLVERIGLDADDNRNLTRRILLLDRETGRVDALLARPQRALASLRPDRAQTRWPRRHPASRAQKAASHNTGTCSATSPTRPETKKPLLRSHYFMPEEGLEPPTRGL